MCGGGIVNCNCDLIKKLKEIVERNKVMQLLMGLDDRFEGVKNFILSKDTLPNINRAFYLVKQAKSQKEVSKEMRSPKDSSAMVAGRQKLQFFWEGELQWSRER